LKVNTNTISLYQSYVSKQCEKKKRKKNCDSWHAHLPVICMVAINDETQIKGEFDNDAIYHFSVMPLQNVKNSR
jgi:hypothetical protein